MYLYVCKYILFITYTYKHSIILRYICIIVLCMYVKYVCTKGMYKYRFCGDFSLNNYIIYRTTHHNDKDENEENQKHKMCLYTSWHIIYVCSI